MKNNIIQLKHPDFIFANLIVNNLKMFSQKSHKKDYRKKIRHFLLHVTAIVPMWSMKEPACISLLVLFDLFL